MISARTNITLGLLSLPLALLLAAPAWGQAAQVASDPGPHYVGEAVSIRVTAVGFEEDPAPKAEAPRVSGGSLVLVGVSPSVNQSITIINGQMSRTREVTHVFQFRFVADRPGDVRIGPFRIHQGTRQASAAAVRLRVQDVPSSNDLALQVELPEGPVFVGERIPVTVSFTFEAGLQKNLLEYRLRVPLFEDPGFRFLDSGQEGETNVQIATDAGTVELRGTSKQYRANGKRYTTVSVTRLMVPLSPGRYAIPKASLTVEEGIRFRRDFFGGRRATQARRWRTESKAAELEVAQIPGQQQPPSFGGAIGRGFTLDVSADRTVVQVGDPITLTFRLQGEGLETASLPPLDAEGLLPKSKFRVPEDVPTGETVDSVKQFSAVVRVLSEDVTEIPELTYSWFDPDTRAYQSTTSRPIALSVRSAEVIGAGQVEVVASPESLAAEQSAGQGDAPRARSLVLTGADLAIERDPARVLGAARELGGVWLSRSLYAGSLLLLVAAYWDRRRRDVDPATTRRNAALQEELRRLREAESLSGIDAVNAVSQALRRMLQQVPEASSPEIDAFLGECDARTYAPSGAPQALESGFTERATALGEGIAKVAR